MLSGSLQHVGCRMLALQPDGPSARELRTTIVLSSLPQPCAGSSGIQLYLHVELLPNAIPVAKGDVKAENVYMPGQYLGDSRAFM